MAKERVEGRELEKLIKDALSKREEPVDFSSVIKFANDQVANGPRRIDEMDLREALWRLMGKNEVALTPKRLVTLVHQG